jgi:hypothetical protein
MRASGSPVLARCVRRVRFVALEHLEKIGWRVLVAKLVELLQWIGQCRIVLSGIRALVFLAPPDLLVSALGRLRLGVRVAERGLPLGGGALRTRLLLVLLLLLFLLLVLLLILLLVLLLILLFLVLRFL